MRVSAHVRVSGPLSSHVAGFSAELAAQGYTDLSLANQLRLMADLSRWLERQRISPELVTPKVIDRFLAKRRRTHTQFVSWAAITPLVSYLRARSVVPEATSVGAPRSELLCRYEKYLDEERGVTPVRRASCLGVAEMFLGDRLPSTLSAADVAEFARAHARAGGLAAVLSALRSVLRYLFVSGESAVNLVYAVPRTPCRRLASLPKALEPSELQAVLATCDRRTTAGRRDYAVLLLMVRLGLRAGEIAALTLDDLDWKAGEVVVRGKGGTLSRLPLPSDVGEALVAYLRRRRRGTNTRSLFLRTRAPYRGAKPMTVRALAGRALRAAGVAAGGGHRLRHTAATEMLRRGASLTEIAQVLRHRHVDTTAIYTKVDRDRLQALAQPWPAEGSPDRADLQALTQPWPGGAS